MSDWLLRQVDQHPSEALLVGWGVTFVGLVIASRPWEWGWLALILAPLYLMLGWMFWLMFRIHRVLSQRASGRHE